MEIKIDFERGEEPYVYRDSIYFTQEQYDALTTEQVEAMKDERYANWYDSVMNPTIVEIPTNPPKYITIMGEDYEILITAPVSGDKLIEAYDTWYKRVI